MSTLVLNSNNHIPKTKKKFLEKIAKDTVSSFKLEGIIITLEEAYQMAIKISASLEKDKKSTES